MLFPLPRVISDIGPGGGIVNSMQAINALHNSMLQNKYYGPQAQSEIDNRNALTNGQNITNQFLPDKLRLANAFAGLQNQYYGPNMQAEINGRNALTNRYNTMLPLEQEELRLKNQFYPEVTKSNIASQQAMQNFRNAGGANMGVGQKEFLGLMNQLSNEHPDWDRNQVNQAASAYISGDNSLSDGTPLPPMSGLGQSYVDQIIKRGTTAQGLNQQRFAATTDKILNEGEKLIPSISQYAGALGKAQGNIDKVKSSLGQDTPAYNDYLYFTRTFAPYAAGEMMRALGVNASDSQKELYQKVINPISWDSNPKTAMENYKKMTKLFKNTVSKTVGKSTGEIRSGLRANNEPTPQSKATLRYNPQTGDFEDIR